MMVKALPFHAQAANPPLLKTTKDVLLIALVRSQPKIPLTPVARAMVPPLKVTVALLLI